MSNKKKLEKLFNPLDREIKRQAEVIRKSKEILRILSKEVKK